MTHPDYRSRRSRRTWLTKRCEGLENRSLQFKWNSEWNERDETRNCTVLRMRRNCYTCLDGVRCDSSGELQERKAEKSVHRSDRKLRRRAAPNARLLRMLRSGTKRCPRLELSEDRTPSKDRREVIMSAVDIQRSAGCVYHVETSAYKEIISALSACRAITQSTQHIEH